MSTAARPRAQEKRDVALAEAQAGLHELLAAERRLRGRDQQRGEEKLSHAQVRALVALGAREEATAGELARAADLNPASVTAMLDHLEARGIVERRRSSTDRRCVHVSLTAQGQTLLDEKRARWRSLWEDRLGDTSERDIAAAARVMREIAAMLDEL